MVRVRNQVIVFCLALATPALAAPTPEQISGVLKRIDTEAGHMEVNTGQGRTMLVTINDETTATRGGDTVTLEGIEIGSNVRVALVPGKARAHATAVTVTSFLCRFTKAEPGRVTLQSLEGKPFVVAVNGQTKFTKVTGQEGTAGDFKPGEPVWLALTASDTPTAASINLVVSPGQGGRPGIAVSKPRTPRPRAEAK
jgi:hypothetical protein